MRRVIVTLGVWWFVVALTNANAQSDSPLQPSFVTVRSLQLDSADSLPEAIANVVRERVVGSRLSKAELGTHSTGRLRQVLYSYGYMEAVVDPPGVKPAGDNLVDLIFHVEPGTRYYISGLAIGGVEAFSPQQIRDLIPIHPGDPVDGYKLKRALNDIRHLYACSGFLDANPLVSDNYHRATRTLFFTVRMHAGEVSTIASVKVVGLEQGLVDKIITLPELQPNGVFSSCRIREAIRALWLHGDSSPELSFAVRADVDTPQRVHVQIDFSAGHVPHDEVRNISRPAPLKELKPLN